MVLVDSNNLDPKWRETSLKDLIGSGSGLGLNPDNEAGTSGDEATSEEVCFLSILSQYMKVIQNNLLSGQSSSSRS